MGYVTSPKPPQKPKISFSPSPSPPSIFLLLGGERDPGEKGGSFVIKSKIEEKYNQMGGWAKGYQTKKIFFPENLETLLVKEKERGGGKASI